MEALAVIALVVGTVLVLLVPALFWSALVAALYELARNKVQASLKKAARKVTMVLSARRSV